MPYQRKDLALDLVRVHDDRFSNLGGDKYFACVDMKGADGKIYDIDFFMLVKPGKLTVTETSVHKINGKPLYNWKQEGGVWKKVKVVSCSRGCGRVAVSRRHASHSDAALQMSQKCRRRFSSLRRLITRISPFQIGFMS